MGEFYNYLTSRIKAIGKDTVGWIQFMPPEGIDAAKKGIFRLEAIETWRSTPSVPFTPNVHDEHSFEDFFNKNVILNNYKDDVLEGRCVYSEFPIHTEFVSCFTIIRKEDLDCTGKLNKDKVNELKQYGTGHDSFIYIKSTNKHDKSDDLYNFAWSIHDAFNPIHDRYFSNGIVASDVFVRPVAYLSLSDYYRMGVEAEKISDIGGGLPPVKNWQAAKAYDRLEGGIFGLFAKPNYFEKQREARMGVTFSRPIHNPWIDIHAKCAKKFIQICVNSDINTITFL